MNATETARESARVFRDRDGGWAWFSTIEGSRNGEAHLWLDNGYGVSLIDWPGDELPELLAMRRGDDSPVTVHGERSTDPTGLMRMCTVDDVVKVLNELRERES